MSKETKALAKDVARELSAQRRRRKVGTYAVFGALLAAAIMFVRCGSGWGLGGNGNGDAGKEISRPVAGETMPRMPSINDPGAPKLSTNVGVVA